MGWEIPCWPLCPWGGAGGSHLPVHAWPCKCSALFQGLPAQEPCGGTVLGRKGCLSSAPLSPVEHNISYEDFIHFLLCLCLSLSLFLLFMTLLHFGSLGSIFESWISTLSYIVLIILFGEMVRKIWCISENKNVAEYVCLVGWFLSW